VTVIDRMGGLCGVRYLSSVRSDIPSTKTSGRDLTYNSIPVLKGMRPGFGFLSFEVKVDLWREELFAEY
jgi:hypothetical protein